MTATPPNAVVCFFYLFIFFLAAQLLRQGHHSGVPEEDCHLLPAADQRERGDHVRLQVPHRRRQDPVSVRSGELQGDPELERGVALCQKETGIHSNKMEITPPTYGTSPRACRQAGAHAGESRTLSGVVVVYDFRCSSTCHFPPQSISRTTLVSLPTFSQSPGSLQSQSRRDTAPVLYHPSRSAATFSFQSVYCTMRIM